MSTLISPELLTFIALAAVGSYVQAVSGFAMGLIIIAGGAALAVAPMPVVTAAISLVSFVNIVYSLRGHLRSIHRDGFVLLIAGQLPLLVAGVWLLDYLNETAEVVLRLLLGAFVLAGCTSMMFKPEPRPEVSSRAGFVLAGAGGGLLGGLFAAAAPVMGWFLYSQPLGIAQIRATLLACFFTTTVARTVVVGATGGITDAVMQLVLWSLPVVIFFTWLGRNHPPPFGDTGMRRAAFSMLFVMGLWILGSAVFDVLDHGALSDLR